MVSVSGDDELENKYRRSVLDIAILQDHIGEQHHSFPLCSGASNWLSNRLVEHFSQVSMHPQRSGNVSKQRLVTGFFFNLF